jgi:hypothetical protein
LLSQRDAAQTRRCCVPRQVLARQLPFLDRTAMIMRVCGQGAGDAKTGGREAPPEDLALLAAAGLRRCVPRRKAYNIQAQQPGSAP